MQPFNLFSGKVNFNSLPVVQDKNGVYYLNPDKTYYEPIYSHFYDELPKGVTRHTDGSHASKTTFTWRGVTYTQQPVDVYMVAWSMLSGDWDWVVEYQYGDYNKPDGYVIITHGDWVLLLGHCYTEVKIGTVVKAGDCFAKTNPSMGHCHLTAGFKTKGVDIAEEIMKLPIPEPPIDTCPIKLAHTQELLEQEQLEHAGTKIKLIDTTKQLDEQKQINDQLIERNSAQDTQIQTLEGINTALNEKYAKSEAENLQLKQEVAKLEADLAEANKTITINITINLEKDEKIVNQKLEIENLNKRIKSLKDTTLMTVGERLQLLYDGVIVSLKDKFKND